MKQKYIWIVCAVWFWMAGCQTPVLAVKGMDVILEMMQTEAGDPVAFGDSVTLGGTLTFSVPEDWACVPKDQLGQDMLFLYFSSDGGITVNFAGMMMDREAVKELGIRFVGDIRTVLDETAADYSLLTFHGLELFFSGDDGAGGGFCLTEEGNLVCFTIVSETGDLSDVLRSDKLSGDIAAILHSMRLPD